MKLEISKATGFVQEYKQQDDMHSFLMPTQQPVSQFSNSQL
jgi:hypothetical protein